MSIDINDLGGPAGDSFKFANIGDKAKGTIIHAEKTERVNTFTNLSLIHISEPTRPY